MRRTSSLVLATLLLAACAAQLDRAQVADRMVPPDNYKADIYWLADDARKGRDTGSPELEQVEQWVADKFEAAGLQPLGDDGGWLQHFKVRGERRLTADGNVLVIGGRTLDLGREWRPLRSALTATATGPLVFAGYGISDPDGKWDDYAGLDVKDKVVVVLRKGPRCDVPGTRYCEGDPPGSNAAREQISFASKINAAFRHGAAALLVVNDPAHYAAGTPQDEAQRFRMGGGESGTVAASLPAASLTAAAGAALGLDLAAIQKAMDADWKPHGEELPKLTASLSVKTERPDLPTANVLGFLPGNDPALEGEYVLIGAHMDHLGLGGGGSSRGGPSAVGQIHNGADDNASGTAGLVEVARVLGAHRGALRRGVVFAGWSGEELGLLGSHHYVDDPKLPLNKLVAVVNMDMIGRSSKDYLAIEGVGSSPGFSDLVIAAQKDLGTSLDLHLAQRPSDNSDQASFYEKNVPVLAFFTGLHDDYHMPSDDADKINVPAAAAIASLAGEVVCRLADLDVRPPFVRVPAATPKGGDPHAGPQDPSAGPVPYKVVLGTSPDMTYQNDDGVRVSSVRAGTPAEACGIKAGDILTALDGQPIHTLEDFSTLLFSHKPGDTIHVSVRRGAETLAFTAVLAGRVGDN